MDANTERDALLVKLRLWGSHRHALENRRDPLVREALAAGISIEEIHKATDLGRTTIDRIKKEADSDS